MHNSRRDLVVGLEGLRGTLLDSPPEHQPEAPVRISIDDGPTIEVPASMLRPRGDGTYSVPISPAVLERARSRNSSGNTAVIPVLAEELVVNKEAVPTGGIRVHRRTLEHEETVDLPLVKEHVDVRRVVVDRAVEGPLPVRREGDTTIIPIVEEVLIIEKRFRLKEEIHVVRSTREERHQERVTVHRQEAEIERLDENGRSAPVDVPAEKQERPRRTLRRKSILAD